MVIEVRSEVFRNWTGLTPRQALASIAALITMIFGKIILEKISTGLGDPNLLVQNLLLSGIMTLVACGFGCLAVYFWKCGEPSLPLGEFNLMRD